MVTLPAFCRGFATLVIQVDCTTEESGFESFT